MAFADTQTLTVNGVAKAMPLVLTEPMHTRREMGDLTFSLDIKHRMVTRDKKRRIVTLTTFAQRKIVPDPLTSVNDYETLSESLQIDRPEVAFTSTEVTQHHSAFVTWLDSTNVGKLYARES